MVSIKEAVRETPGGLNYKINGKVSKKGLGFCFVLFVLNDFSSSYILNALG